MILFFDVETTGLPVRNGLLGEQPHIVQIAAIFMGESKQEYGCLSAIIKPDEWTVGDSVKVHGISDEMARGRGIPLKSAMAMFFGWARQATLVVAHNAKFDLGMIGFEGERCWGKAPPQMPSFCTMEASAPIVNLPPTARMLAAGFDKPKAPKLEECMDHFFQEKLEGAHDALVDVRACSRVFFKLLELGAGPAF